MHFCLKCDTAYVKCLINTYIYSRGPEYKYTEDYRHQAKTDIQKTKEKTHTVDRDGPF